MSEMLKKYGGLILFYGIIILGVFLLNERCRYLKEQQEIKWQKETQIAIQMKGEEKDEFESAL